MNRFFVPFFLLGASFSLAPRPASAVPITIPTVVVGNPGNGNDPSDGDVTSPGIQNFGAVAKEYKIGTTEVTNAQYAAFLNEKAKSDPLALYNPNMGFDFRGGITRSGVSGSYTYAPKAANMADKPVNFVSWYDSIRFANWLHNGQGTGDTETGAYTLLGGTPTPSNGSSITRNVGATWWLPSENEWYKSAYHQPAAQGGDADNYWLYPTKSNIPPTVALANFADGDISNPGANVANYNNGADWNSQNGNVTTVGSAGSLSRSFYGTSDQGGNVWEWNEAFISGSSRGLRGGSWFDGSSELRSVYRANSNSTAEYHTVGFRVATVPEPSTAALGVAGIALIWALRKRLK